MNTELDIDVKGRVLRAFLDLAILVALANHAMTGYEVSTRLVKNLGVPIGSGTVYYKIYAMQEEGWVKCARNRKARLYGLTEKGKEITDNMNQIVEEIETFTKALLKT